MEKNGKQSGSGVLTGLIYIIIGVLFIIFQNEMISWILTVTGILFIIDGIIEMVTGRLVGGIFTAAIGVIVILCGWLIVKLALIIFGVFLAIYGILMLITVPLNFFSILRAVVTVTVGVLLAISNQATITWLYIVIGTILIANGLLYCFSGISDRRK